ncbi:uncharacterized protein LOC8274153 [Ricinus communis]|uniref:uncharacterized protein LOC8274153 n=1 Tax=Ricinus communis TaxID=3988 RepID=UPI00201B08D7|nr:uncharacterized protein LOC8274153 [Ricinus communis]
MEPKTNRGPSKLHRIGYRSSKGFPPQEDCLKPLTCGSPAIVANVSTNRAPINMGVVPRGTTTAFARVCRVRASVVDSYESSSNFIKRMEQAWLISQQPRPVGCTSCNSNGHVDCKWCAGTGFFILGDNILCQVPSRNTTCVICAGKVY